MTRKPYTAETLQEGGRVVQRVYRDGVVVWERTGREPMDLAEVIAEIRERDERYDYSAEFLFVGRGD